MCGLLQGSAIWAHRAQAQQMLRSHDNEWVTTNAHGFARSDGSGLIHLAGRVWSPGFRQGQTDYQDAAGIHSLRTSADAPALIS